MTVDLAVLRGPRRARHAVCDHLEKWLNPRLEALNLAEPGLHVPKVAEFYPAWQPQSKGTNWPKVMTTSHHGEVVDRLDLVDGDPVYLWHWTVRAWVWARGDSYDETAERAEAIAGGIVDVFLGRPALGDPTDGLAVLAAPLTVSLSDVVPTPRMAGSIAGAFAEAVVSMAETAPADPALGTASNLTVTAEPLEEP